MSEINRRLEDLNKRYPGLIPEITQAEGRRSKPYLCPSGDTTIGVGRNLDDRGVNDDEIDQMLCNDIGVAIGDCVVLYGAEHFDSMSQNRQQALIEMAFNLGRARLSGFVKMNQAILNNLWDVASAEALDSRWAGQVGPVRSRRIARKLIDLAVL